MARLQTLIRDVGRAGIRAFGYNFSIAGVAGRKSGPLARGGAETVYVAGPDERPIPLGMVWNMRYAPGGSGRRREIAGGRLWLPIGFTYGQGRRGLGEVFESSLSPFPYATTPFLLCEGKRGCEEITGLST